MGQGGRVAIAGGQLQSRGRDGTIRFRGAEGEEKIFSLFLQWKFKRVDFYELSLEVFHTL